METFGPISRRTIVVQSAPVRAHDGSIEGIVFVSRDVTDQRLAERAGREAERRFEIAFDRAPIGMALVGVDGSVERVNAALAAITGRSAAELPRCATRSCCTPTTRSSPPRPSPRCWPTTAWPPSCASSTPTATRCGSRCAPPSCATTRARRSTCSLQVQDITERRSLEDQLRHLADHDALTGLLNRRGIDRALAQHVARGRRYGAQGALLVLDLDGFKAVNDTPRPCRRRRAHRHLRHGAAGTACARPTSSGAWAATSSRSCSPPRARRRRSPSPRRSSPSSARSAASPRRSA